MSEDFTYLENLISNRKVVRNYKKFEFDPEKLKNISKFSVKIPTAGFSRGIEILQVTNKQNIKNIAEHFNELEYTKKGKPKWISNSICLFFILLNENAYHQRYESPDKIKSVSSKDWDIPYWYVDAGAAIMNCMLLIEEQELKSGFMGLHNTDRDGIHKMLNIPNTYKIIGMITSGVEDNIEIDKKSKTKISDNVFVGSNTSLVAPIKIEKDSIIGAGSVITKNVKKKTLALTRTPQIEVKNYKRKKK